MNRALTREEFLGKTEDIPLSKEMTDEQVERILKLEGTAEPSGTGKTKGVQTEG